MEKLKKIILQLDNEKYQFVEKTFVDNHSNKFLILLQHYRSNASDDLLELLKCNENALYVLKSRLYDKIQKHLLEFMRSQDFSIEKQPVSLDEYLVLYPRDTAIAMLHEMEKEYSKKSDFVNLINLYSVLKKAYHYSDKYYLYTQLFNKHVAYAISLEKANDVLLDFNRTLSNYYFSDSSEDIEKLVLLKDEIKNICFLNNSHNIELIYNLVLIQLSLFANVELHDEEPVEDILKVSDEIFKKHTQDPQTIKFEPVFDFLKFEYYQSTNQHKKALLYYEKVNEDAERWLLNNNYCIAFKFLSSKLQLIQQNKGAFDDLLETENFQHDFYDFYSIVALKFYQSVKKYYIGETKEAITLLNKILDDSSFVNFSYMEFEIKLTLAFFYIKKKEYELAGNLL
ncbi:MAG: hypothetical protein JNL69_11105, partial [Bacteroidia bacterium]|nr:hypothetical protein [Bacteroidia bacterium]